MSLANLYLVSPEGFNIEAYSTPDMQQANTLVLRVFAPPHRYNEKFDIVYDMGQRIKQRLEEKYNITSHDPTDAVYRARGNHITLSITPHNASGLSQHTGYTPEMAEDVRHAAISAFFSQGMDIDLKKSTKNSHLHPSELKAMITAEERADMERGAESNKRDESIIKNNFKAICGLITKMLPEMETQRPHFIPKLQELMKKGEECIEKGIITPEITPAEQVKEMQEFSKVLRQLENILRTGVMRGILYEHHMELDSAFISLKKTLRNHYEIILPQEKAPHLSR